MVKEFYFERKKKRDRCVREPRQRDTLGLIICIISIIVTTTMTSITIIIDVNIEGSKTVHFWDITQRVLKGLHKDRCY